MNHCVHVNGAGGEVVIEPNTAMLICGDTSGEDPNATHHEGCSTPPDLGR